MQFLHRPLVLVPGTMAHEVESCHVPAVSFLLTNFPLLKPASPYQEAYRTEVDVIFAHVSLGAVAQVC
jgi:hypothetical protein